MTTIEHLYHIFQQYPIICTDTRKITPNSLFFALKGDNFDANGFAKQALALGAVYVVVDNPELAEEPNMLLVEDVLATLQDLARFHRQQLNIPVIGITGSNGKTTTKELIKSVLSQKYKTFATHGNLNNHIGVPLSILSIDKDVEVAIIEMGANHQKEIAFLCSIAKPTYGLITNVGHAHLEGFGGFEGVKKGKKELYDYIKESGGQVFLNVDHRYLREMAGECGLDREQIFSYGENSQADIKGKVFKKMDFVSVYWLIPNEKVWHIADSNLVGIYNFENILAAVAVGYKFNLTNDEIKRGIESYVPSNSRSQVVKTERNTLICDYYNANLSSMEVAISNFSDIPSAHKLVILGDMFELGEYSYEAHNMIINILIAKGFKNVMLIGNNFSMCKSSNNSNYLFFETTQQVIDYLKANPINNHLILIKGSRGMKLETIADLLT
jgi:UDP-N-acetylmuramoyl-tripeptide--D-alanyl-D-alanine ligase